MVSAIILVMLLLIEGKRLGMRYLWLPVSASFTVGVPFGLLLFFRFKQLGLEILFLILVNASKCDILKHNFDKTLLFKNLQDI